MCISLLFKRLFSEFVKRSIRSKYTVKLLCTKLCKQSCDVHASHFVGFLKGHEHNFKNSTVQKHIYTIGNLLTVVKFSVKLLYQYTEDKYRVISL